VEGVADRGAVPAETSGAITVTGTFDAVYVERPGLLSLGRRSALRTAR
jgi:hypothetical protein